MKNTPIAADEYRKLLKARLNGNLGFDGILNSCKKTGAGALVSQSTLVHGDVFSFRARYNKEKKVSINPFVVVKLGGDEYNVSQGQTYKIGKDQEVIKVGHIDTKQKLGETGYTLEQFLQTAVVLDLEYNKKLLKDTTAQVEAEKEKEEAK
jgi:hypothetical protein